MTTAPVLDAALLRALVRLEQEVRALRETVDAQGRALRDLRAALVEDAPSPAAVAPLPAGGGAAQKPPPDFAAAFAGRTGGARRGG